MEKRKYPFSNEHFTIQAAGEGARGNQATARSACSGPGLVSLAPAYVSRHTRKSILLKRSRICEKEKRMRRRSLNELAARDVQRDLSMEKLEFERLASARMLGDHGEAAGKEWVHWQRQAGLFDRMAEITYAAIEQKESCFSLPSHGHQYQDCGKMGMKGCLHGKDHPSGKGFGRLFKRSCGRAECPVCYEAWAGKEGMKALIKIAAFCVGHIERRGQIRGRNRKLVVKDVLVGFDRVSEVISSVKHAFAREPSMVIRQQIALELETLIRESGKYIKHFLLSPPQNVDWDKIDAFRSCRERSYEIAQACGIMAGGAFPHPYRIRCSGCGEHPIQDWADSCPKCGSTAFEWYFSPHFHAVGVGWTQDTVENYEKTGWVVKNLGVRKSVFWTVQYLLSHAGIRKGIHTVTWFGRLCSNRMEKTPILGAIREICPFCGRYLHPLIWAGLDPPPFEKFQDDVDRLLESAWILEPSDWRTF